MFSFMMSKLLYFHFMTNFDDKDKNTKQHNNPNFNDATVHPSTGDAQPSKTEGEEEEENPPIDMSFPKEGPLKMIVYILTFPLMAPMYVTLPDTRNKEFTFFPSFKTPGIKLLDVLQQFN